MQIFIWSNKNLQNCLFSGLTYLFPMSWNIEQNVWKYSVSQENATYLLSRGLQIPKLQLFLVHRIVQSQAQFSTILLDPVMSNWNIISILHFKQENIPFKKQESPCFLPKSITLFISNGTQRKSGYLLKDCLESMESEEGLLQPEPVRLDEVCRNTCTIDRDLLKKQMIWLPRFRASFSSGHQLQSYVFNLWLLCGYFSLRLSCKDFAYTFLKYEMIFSVSALGMLMQLNLISLPASRSF